MKTNVLILCIAVAIIGLYSGCRNCSSCLADGESFDLPYSSYQTINYKNDSQQTKSFLVQISLNLPPDKYCGPIGSQSYGDCGGGSTALLKYNKDSSAVITIRYSTNYSSDAVEQHIERTVKVVNRTMSVYKSVASTYDDNSSVKTIESITIGANQYNNVYVYQNDSAKINACSNFVFSAKYGVLKYTIKLNSSFETWELIR